MRILLISNQHGARGGREQLSSMIARSLHGLAGSDYRLFELPASPDDLAVRERLKGRIDGITAEVEEGLARVVAEFSAECVFIDGSNLGRLARVLKRAGVAAPIITFFHNVEARFFLDAFRAAPAPRAAGVLVANALAEYWAVRHSDRRVMLNERDSAMLARFYRRGGTDIVPMALADGYESAAAQKPSPNAVRYALFVGGAFYANVEGMAWYAREIAPHAPIETVVVGRGMDGHRDRLEQWGGVRVVGPVDDLAIWYAHADLVVAPILSGSGMKTKTAEALMHGKPIAGTPEAFVGYDAALSDELRICCTTQDFIAALRDLTDTGATYDPGLRAAYERLHSPDRFDARVKAIVTDAVTGRSDICE